MINNPYIRKSEIINQKKNFIFNVEQTSTHVFPNEEYTYYIYIKNISGVDIEDFSISIKHPKEVDFIEQPHQNIKKITLKNDEVKLYEMKAFCTMKGEYIVNFFGFGKGTQILAKTLKIKCTTTYNSDKLLHRIHIYDFNPYEENYTLEADDYNEDVVQIFKNQKLPYKSGEQPFPMESVKTPENKESQSFLEQYNEAKNTKEHVYQYISREQFVEDSVEQFTGENLQELIKKINNNSMYFNGKFLGAGNNHLLNDFIQYDPNGFIHRMGLLTSEIYHLLGVIPTYSYMSDYLFRWAPHPSGQHLFFTEEGFKGDDTVLLDLYPKQQAMLWGKNVWGGTGWIIYKIPTEEYKQTDEYKKQLDDGNIILKEKIEFFEEENDAIEFIKKQEEIDKYFLSERGSDIVEYEYIIEPSLYDTGVFFVNIPVNKIPKNFFVPNTEVLYPIIERVKPFGTKPIINYVIETSFQLDMEQKIIPNYYESITFNHDNMNMFLDVAQYQLKSVNKTCDGHSYSVMENIPIQKYLEIPTFSQNIMLDIDSSNINMLFTNNNGFNTLMQQKVYGLHGEPYINIKTFKDVSYILYNNNYNNISFYISSQGFYKLKTNSLVQNVIEKENDYHLKIDFNEDITRSFDGIKINTILELEEFASLTIYDKFDNQYQLISEYDNNNKLTYIKYKKINSNQQESIKKEGAISSPQGIGFKFIEINNKYLVVFFVQKDNVLHYFTHIIVSSIEKIKCLGNTQRLLQNISYSNNSLLNKITLNTPVIYTCKRLNPSFVLDGDNWTNLYRFNNKKNSYAFCNNQEYTNTTPSNITLHYDNIDIPETSIINQIRFKVQGTGAHNNQIYLYNAKNTNYLFNNANGSFLQKRPNKLETYHQANESTEYYKIHLKSAQEKKQTKYIKEIETLLNQNIIFNEETNIGSKNFLKNENDYIEIRHPYWCELSEFEFPAYNLNNTKKMSLVIEGFNENEEIPILSQVLSETNYASEVESTIPSGYFYKKIPLLYPNSFLLEYIRVRFRFKEIIKNVKIFNTALEIEFNNKEEDDINFEFIDNQICSLNTYFEVSAKDIYPSDFNNGLTLQMQFDELRPGSFYNLNTNELEILYKETSINFIANGNYQKTPLSGIYKSIITGEQNDAYLRGEFYDDYETVSQIQSNINSNNKGIELQNEIYQSFIAKDDNITAVEIYPNGFVGQPDELLRIGLYTNHENTPDDLITEVYGTGWTKSNEYLRTQSSIKYNINVENLIPGETYWIRFKVENPRDKSYYRLKSTNETVSGYKLLTNENNNYINTFSCLTFNIYSRNIIKSFNNIPAMQELLDDPNILIGLNKGQGTINNLSVNKYKSTIFGDDYMANSFTQDISQNITIIKDGKEYTTDGKEIKKEGENND